MDTIRKRTSQDRSSAFEAYIIFCRDFVADVAATPSIIFIFPSLLDIFMRVYRSLYVMNEQNVMVPLGET